jgi:hypothetical protein
MAAVLVAPMLLGPATAPLMRMLGGEAKHLCACGMEPGKCGCPECERLEADKREAHRAQPFAVLRSSCDSDDAPVPAAAPLPPAVVPMLARVAAPSTESVAIPARARDARSRDPNAPETPPPRSLVAS